MLRSLGLLCLTLPLLTVPGSLAAQGLRLIPGIEEVENDSLADVAYATVDEPHPVIYYNPRLMRRFGPLLADFFLAHEYGHLALKHTRVGFASLPDARRRIALQSQELEADCYAARELGTRERRAVEAALRFFNRLGQFSFDELHPTGAQRAARILSCLPGDRADLALNTGDNGIESGLPGGAPDEVSFRVETEGLAAGAQGRVVRLWIDGKPVGSLSNMRFPSSLTLEHLSAGIHTYRLVVECYSMDGTLQLQPAGTLIGSGQISPWDGDAFKVQVGWGEEPRLERDVAGR